ncbi:glycoside hydrolase family 2 TIM barrel-domain containing protein [Cerasicoccus maritimus]|uniref:glycoside hydrolase family 2 TIM barrel-domain containing protein n=1 Tax=Cerasicoccus maritimus TaxID=490089 RepID=UPI0028529047|nr:glycoside hydrolase family 2 TIM barrel-domain containing protein [Cerasicoccus maritimus]
MSAGTLFAGSDVKIEKTAPHKFELRVDGQPFFANGVGGYNNLPMLKKMGGNCFRTWGIESLEERIDGKPLLDYAESLGLKVVVGIWIGHERHGFDYTDEKQLRKQRKDVENAVRKYKDHPAILMWGLGNEMEGPISDGSEIRIWKELNRLAKIVKDEDPDHPVMTVIAGIGGHKVKNIIEYYPEIDVLGVNAYASAPGVGGGLVEQGWEKPFMLTEFGPSGHWEVGHTSWGAPIEPTSREKAASYFATQKRVIEEGQGLCLGSFAFLWSHKQETTATWYGMFLPSGEKLGSVDAMSYAWNGEFPDNRSPKLISLSSPADQKRVKRNSVQKAQVEVRDAEGDPLKIEWVVTAESTDRQTGGDHETTPPSFPNLIKRNGGESVEFRAPSKSGPYRLFVYIRDNAGGAATANFPFYVE